ncbi:hypothetical protein D3C78_1524730 [compost metagenome]
MSSGRSITTAYHEVQQLFKKLERDILRFFRERGMVHGSEATQTHSCFTIPIPSPLLERSFSQEQKEVVDSEFPCYIDIFKFLKKKQDFLFGNHRLQNVRD